MEYFCLPIAEMDYYDLSPTPPIFQHFDLISGEIGNGFAWTRFTWYVFTSNATWGDSCSWTVKIANPLSQKGSGFFISLFAYDCYHQFSGTTTITIFAEVDTLPCAEIQLLLKLMAKIAILRWLLVILQQKFFFLWKANKFERRKWAASQQKASFLHSICTIFATIFKWI